MKKVLNYPILSRDFYANEDCAAVAQQLLGKILVVHKHGELRAGRIVETEAYLGPHDLAAHTSKGLTARNQAMFGEPGHAYVYLIYGIHHCMNTVTGPVGSGSGVLLRAIEPVLNVGANTNGPGRLCKALGIDRSDYGTDLCVAESIYLLDAPSVESRHIMAKPRVGVDYAGEWALKPLRFYDKNSAYISRK